MAEKLVKVKRETQSMNNICLTVCEPVTIGLEFLGQRLFTHI